MLAARGQAVTVERVERAGPGPFPDAPAASLAVAKALAPVVRSVVDAGRLPLVLAGSCDASLGVLAGFDHSVAGSSGSTRTPISTPPSRRSAVSSRACLSPWSRGIATPSCGRRRATRPRFRRSALSCWEPASSHPRQSASGSNIPRSASSPGTQASRKRMSRPRSMGSAPTWRRSTCMSTTTRSIPPSLPGSSTSRFPAGSPSSSWRRSSAPSRGGSASGRPRWPRTPCARQGRPDAPRGAPRHRAAR
jgi:hypothetical protein